MYVMEGLRHHDGRGTDVGDRNGLAGVTKILQHVLDQNRALSNDAVYFSIVSDCGV
jgi:hypothetical protein